MYAIVKTGGKQYRISEGDILNVEKIEGSKGEAVIFDKVLMVSTDKGIEVGTPYVIGARVVSEITDQKRAPKIMVFRMKRRKGYRKKTGHRQELTSLKIKEISV